MAVGLGALSWFCEDSSLGEYLKRSAKRSLIYGQERTTSWKRTLVTELRVACGASSSEPKRPDVAGGIVERRQEVLVLTAVTATVVYGIVKLPPITSMAVPTPSGTFASLSAGRRMRALEVGIWSSPLSWVLVCSQSNSHSSGSMNSR